MDQLLVDHGLSGVRQPLLGYPTVAAPSLKVLSLPSVLLLLVDYSDHMV